MDFLSVLTYDCIPQDGVSPSTSHHQIGGRTHGLNPLSVLPPHTSLSPSNANI